MSEPFVGERAETAIPLKYVRAKAVDLNRNAQGLTDREAAVQMSAAFSMGWNARENGLAINARPSFANDDMIVEWIAGWEERDVQVRRITAPR